MARHPKGAKPLSRSEVMSRIRGKDTGPEMVIRRGLHARGLRYSLHRRDLPGTPDLVFPSKKAVVFVHGCFWHGHEGCVFFRMPKTNVAFWEEKIGRNRERDQKNTKALEEAGWKVITVWECSIRGRSEPEVSDFLDELAEELKSLPRV